MSQKISPEELERLRTEAQNPYRTLRQFIYVCFAISGFIGGVVFLAQIAAGRDLQTSIPNFAVQAGVVALMIFLWRWEDKNKKANSKKKK